MSCRGANVSNAGLLFLKAVGIDFVYELSIEIGCTLNIGMAVCFRKKYA